MAVQSVLCVALFLLVPLSHICATQSEAVAEPEAETHHEIQISTQNEAAQSTINTAKKLAEIYNASAVLSKEDFTLLLADLQTGLRGYKANALIQNCAKSTSVLLENGARMNCSDVLIQCPGVEEVYRRHAQGGGMRPSQLSAALQQAALSATSPVCRTSPLHHKGYKPTTAQAWGYSIGFVTLVCIISNIGGLLTPLMGKTFFQRLLQFLVAMGAGTLVATGLFVLLPEAFDIVSIEELSEDYMWKSATAVFSIYVFFVSERFFKFFMKKREFRNIERNVSVHVESPSSMESDVNDEDKDHMTAPGVENGQSLGEDHGHSHFLSPTSSSSGAGKKRRGPVATLAWMVLMGDVMHNFVDGMAIGAAFTENVYLGVSIGIAVLCEELPHELGDVAILLHSGMSMKRALFLNFLSACVCYVGLILGVVLGENTTANRWILAVAGGLFLYVPLVDMLPDMSNHLDMKIREGNKGQGKQRISREAWWILACQSVGLLLGMCIILLVINLSGFIEIN